MAKIQVKLDIGPEVDRLLRSLPSEIAKKVFPKVMAKVTRPIPAALRQKLPDGDAPAGRHYPQGTRGAQTDEVKKRFPFKMKEHVKSKIIRDELGVMKTIGVEYPSGAHVNFDYGDKALTQGRRHVMWGRTSDQRLRKQTRNIPLELEAEFAELIRKEFVVEIAKAMQKEKL